MESWKICRALDNRIRLELLRRIANSPGHELNVLQAGDFVGLQKAAASQYLKRLAEAGFLAVERSGRYVVCSSLLPADGLVAQVQRALLASLKNASAGSSLDTTLSTINAFAHHVRTRIVKAVAGAGPVGFAALAESTGLPPATLRRQTGVLILANVLSAEEDGDGSRTYSLVRKCDALHRALLKLVLSEE